METSPTEDLMNRAFHSSRSRVQKATRMPGLRRFARGGALLATVIVLAFSFAACGGSSTALTSLSVTPATASIAVGGTQQYVATGTYNNGATVVLTSRVIWGSGTTATATIAAGGLATGVAAGTTTISATLGSVTGTATLTVTSGTLVSIAV